MTPEFIVNHLWQSSCFVLLASVLAFLLRGNSPKVRYWVWLSASLKFLVPWVLLVSLGGIVPFPAHRVATVATSTLPGTLVQMAEPFSLNLFAAVPARAQAHWGVTALACSWAAGFIVIAFTRCRSWLRVRAMLRAGSPVELPIAVPTVIVPSAVEPGIVGFLRPVLVLPALLLERLNPGQLEALLAHELSHVRRRDNFFAALHMGVEAIFWFHPLVWWIGSRMLEERELACDEEVLRLGCKPTDYARGILTVCEHYSEAPLRCVSGVTGADIKKRLRAILAGGIACELTAGKKVAMAAIGLATVAAPIVIGVLNAPSIRAQSAPPAAPQFEVAAIKPCESGALPPGARSGSGSVAGGRLSMNCVTVRSFILGAYVDFENGQRHSGSTLKRLPVEGGPTWINSERYTINAETQASASPEMMQGPMLQALLEERFKLKIHRETREVPIYEMTVAKGGFKPRQSEDGSCTPRDPANSGRPLDPGQKPYCGQSAFKITGPNITAELRSMTLDDFSHWLDLSLDRLVFDKTGIAGRFDFHLEFARDEATPGILARDDSGDPTFPTIFTALQQEFGLKLVPAKGPGDFLVIDSVERPTEN